EQAAQMDPRDPIIAYNLGLLYRQAGRGQEAISALERAVTLRPDYEPARKVLEQLRQQAGVGTQGVPGGTQGPGKGPHAGREGRWVVACGGCAHPPREPIRPAPPDPVPQAPLPEVVVPVSEMDEYAQGSLMQRVLKSAWKLISEPYTALNGGLDTFFNSPGA